MLLGGHLAEAFGLRVPLVVGGIGAVTLATFLWLRSGVRLAVELPGRAGS
jgi:hypothetical protein